MHSSQLMPMDAACCEHACELTKKDIVKRLTQILKPYVEKNRKSKDVVQLLKSLLFISPDFSELLDMYCDEV